jgi:carbon-monoxide dehydrogenase medium subunit
VTHFTTALEPDELLVETVWPAAQRGDGHAFEEFALRHGDYALAMAACVLRVDGGRVTSVRLYVGAAADRPTQIEAPLTGEAVTTELAREAGEAAAAAVEPAGTLHGSTAYRRQLVRVLVERVVTRAWERARG